MVLIKLPIVKAYKKPVFLFIIFLLISILVVVGYLFLKPKSAILNIQTEPQSSVFIDGVQSGRTPFKKSLKPGIVRLRIVPDSFENPLIPFETDIELLGGIETVVRRDFSDLEEMASGEILTFEKIGKGETELKIETYPETTQITINDSVKAFSPYTSLNLESGKHNLKISAPDYKDREVEISLEKGYRLKVFVKLAETDAVLSKEKEPEISEKEDVTEFRIKILDTPTGYLRVRSQPSVSALEIGRVSPGEEYEYVGEDETNEWFEIVFEDNKNGWVSSEYAERIEKP
jgi:hypothetical protein